MYNTDSAFLINYLSSVLQDKYGGPVAYKNPRFGFLFMNDQSARLEKLSSYMPVGKPETKILHSDGKYYPSRSIVFHIDNPNGANVSVVGNNEDITIFTNNTASSSLGSVQPLVTMRSKNASGTDSNRYFTYDVDTGVTGTEAVKDVTNNMNSDNGAVYGHIFKLGPGDYCLGTNTNNDANVYYLCVQGQNDATIGDKTMASIGNTVDHCDFLTAAPTYANYPSSLAAADITFKAYFNEGYAKTFYVKTKEVDSVNYLWIDFSDDPTEFVTYLVTYSDLRRVHYIQETQCQNVNVIYRTTS